MDFRSFSELNNRPSELIREVSLGVVVCFVVAEVTGVLNIIPHCIQTNLLYKFTYMYNNTRLKAACWLLFTWVDPRV